MKFIVSTVTLLKGLRKICCINQCSISILKNFLFEIKEGEMTVTAANLKTSVCTIVKVGTNDSGYFAMSPRILLDTLKCLPEQLLIFKINKRTFGVEIISEGKSYRMRGANAEKIRKEICKRHPNAK